MRSRASRAAAREVREPVIRDRPEAVDARGDHRVVPVRLDLVDHASVAAAAKAAEWSLTNGIRQDLAGQGTLVQAVTSARPRPTSWPAARSDDRPPGRPPAPRSTGWQPG